MAIDYIIGALQLLSAAVNVLALGAFWITPGLRTTANRFVINLLVVNVIGCLALTPALWLHGGLKPTYHTERHPIFDDVIAAATTQQTFFLLKNNTSSDLLRDSNDVDLFKSIETKFECINRSGGKECETVYIQQDNNGLVTEIVDDKHDEFHSVNDNGEVVDIIEDMQEEELSDKDEFIDRSVSKTTELKQEQEIPTKNVFYSDCTRFWGFDLVAALGGLSVLLVVGDTWCAVTDPLRYHSRISGLKSWILITATWFISILFCIASAFRSDCQLITTEITSTLQGKYWRSDANLLPSLTTTASSSSDSSSSSSNNNITSDSMEFNEIYNLIYSCIFFIVIILLPICLVCAMYWKIFSEARQNGLRMRQNGSSPLLQSALNLATASAQVVQSGQIDNNCSVIGEENAIMHLPSESRRNSIAVLPTMRRNSMAASPHHISIKDSTINLNYNKSILVKLHSGSGRVEGVHQQQPPRRYLEIPKLTDNLQNYRGTTMSDKIHKNLSSDESSTMASVDAVAPQQKCTFSPRHLMLLEHDVYSHNTQTGGELRQVHSTPDLQKTINAELIASKKAPEHNKKIHSTGTIHTSAAVLPIQPPSICAPPKALSYMTSIRHRLSNASSIFKYREESRAARISILVVIMFLFSYFPYGLLVLLQGRVTFIANSSFLGVLFLLIANMSSPFIFAYRNHRVRRGVCRLFGVDAKTNERLQKQRILMRNSTHGSSCRERKQKTKIVRINRNSGKSASFTVNATPCKYTAVTMPLNNSNIIDEPQYSIANVVRLNENGIGTKNVIVAIPHEDYYLPSVIDHDDDDSSDDIEALATSDVMEMNNQINLNNCSNPDQSNVNDNLMMTKHIKDTVINISNQKTLNVHNSCKRNCSNSDNINKNNNCNGTTANGNGANNVIKQKISLLKRVCKTSRKLSNCTSNTCNNQMNWDLNATPVNI